MNATQVDAPAGEPRVRPIEPEPFAVLVSRLSAPPDRSSRPAATTASPTRVTLVGELDVATAPVFQECLTDIPGDIEVDCASLAFVDASGLAAFVAAHLRCTRRGSTLVIVDPSPLLSKLLLITGLDTSLHVRATATADAS